MTYNYRFTTNLTILTDDEKVFEKAKKKLVTIFLISENSLKNYDFISYFAHSIVPCDVVIVSFNRPNSMYIGILRTIYSYIYTLEKNYLLSIIDREFPLLEDSVIETFREIEKRKEDIFSTSIPYALPRHLGYITNKFYITTDQKIQTTDDDISYWKSFYEPLLNELYKDDAAFKNIIDHINHKKFIESVEFFGIRPVIVYILYLIYKINKVSDFDSMESLLNFSISIAYYIKNKNKIRDRFG